MAEKDLGKILPLYKGDYSPTTEYELNDCVKLDGTIFWHTSEEKTTGVAPTDIDTWAEFLSGGGGSSTDFDIHALTAEDSLADNDEMPFYDASAGAPRKTTWGNIKAKLKAYFDTLYLGATALVGYATQMWVQSQGYGTYSKPTGGIPKTDLASAVQTSLGLADSALQEHQSLADYSTTAQMNAAISAHNDSTKQNVISDLDDIRSGAELGATALQSVPNTYRTASEQDVIDSGFIKLIGTAGQTIQTNVAVPLNVKNNIVLQHRAFLGFHTHDDNAIGFIGVDSGKPTFLSADGVTATALQGETITDSAGYFTTDTVEGALAEIGAELSGINTLIGSGVIT